MGSHPATYHSTGIAGGAGKADLRRMNARGVIGAHGHFRSLMRWAGQAWLTLVLGAASPALAQAPPEDARTVAAQAGLLINDGRSQQALDMLAGPLAQARAGGRTADELLLLRRAARAAYDVGDLTGALRMSQQLIDGGLRTKDHASAGSGYNQKAIIADQLSLSDSARTCYERALEQFRLAGDSVSCALVIDNLTAYKVFADPPDLAGGIAMSTKALAMLTDSTRERYWYVRAVVLSSLCNYHTWSGHHAEGARYGELSVQAAEHAGSLPMLVHCTTQLAGCYAAGGEPRRAITLLLLSDSLARAHSMPLNKRRDIPQLLSQLYEGLGDHVNALKYFHRYVSIHDSLRSEAASLQLERMEHLHQEQADSLAHAAQLQENTLRHAHAIADERRGKRTALAAALAVLLIAFLLWNGNRRLRGANAAILKAQQALVASEKAREAEALRTRIARDVHDEIGGELTKITLLGRKARRQLTEDPDDAAESVDRIRELSRRLGGTLYDIVWAVDPQRDTAQSLVDHARNATLLLLEGSSLEADLRFTHHGADRSIDPAVRRDIFLVLKEALNNALKHADAQALHVVLETDARGFRLLVKDDGRGIGDGDAPGHGLGNMRARAARAGAKISITSPPGGGTKVEMEGSFAQEDGGAGGKTEE